MSLNKLSANFRYPRVEENYNKSYIFSFLRNIGKVLKDKFRTIYDEVVNLDESKAERYKEEFTSSDLSSGVLSVNHGIGYKLVSVEVIDDSDEVIDPSSYTVSLTDDNNLDIDLSSLTINNTWKVKVIG